MTPTARVLAATSPSRPSGRPTESLEDAVAPLVGRRDPEVDEARRRRWPAPASPGSRKSTGVARHARRDVEAKKTSTTAGMMAMASRFSPRRDGEAQLHRELGPRGGRPRRRTAHDRPRTRRR